jgi:hypothetical protein
MTLVLNKKYKLASSENFDEVMKALGKNFGSLHLYFVLGDSIYSWVLSCCIKYLAVGMCRAVNLYNSHHTFVLHVVTILSCRYVIEL